jgi:replicative DNA helicase
MDPLVNLDAERTCLGAVLVDNTALPVLEGVLKPEHFADQGHRGIYSAMLAMGVAGRHIELVTLKDELGQGLEGVGGATYLADLVAGLPRVGNVEGWADIVLSKARRRAAVSLAEKLIKRATTEDVSTEQLLDDHHAALSRVMESQERGIRKISDVLPAALRKIDDFMESADGIVGLPTGLGEVDRNTGGLKPGELWILAARPSRGKSAFCTQVSVNVAAVGKRVLMFSMEMPPPSVVRRMLYSEAHVDRWDLRRKDRKDEALAKVHKSFADLSGLPIWFDGREAPSIAQIRAASRQHDAKYGVDLIVVDYLQRCSLDSRQDRWVAVGDIAKGLKNLALALDVPVLAACQLNAEAEEKRPTMADLAQARQVIAAEADLIAFLHPEDPQGWRNQDYPQVNFLLDKQRDGATLSLPLSFERPWTRFVEMHVTSLPPGFIDA